MSNFINDFLRGQGDSSRNVPMQRKAPAYTRGYEAQDLSDDVLEEFEGGQYESTIRSQQPNKA